MEIDAPDYLIGSAKRGAFLRCFAVSLPQCFHFDIGDRQNGSVTGSEREFEIIGRFCQEPISFWLVS